MPHMTYRGSLVFLVLAASLLAHPLQAQVRRSNTDLDALGQRRNILVSPSVATLPPGSSEQFSATTVGSAEVEWTATGGSISATGLYTAGFTAGSFTVTARTSGAAVTVAVEIAPNAPMPAGSRMISVHPGQSIQAAVNSHPEGTA